jgi:F-type H+-transporting ATPase subunit gamma
MAAYVDGEVDRVEIFYNGYISPLTQEVTRETLLPLQQATILEGGRGRGARPATRTTTDGQHALVEYEPDPEEILERLVPPTSRSRSTARCSSPPRPSTARA